MAIRNYTWEVSSSEKEIPNVTSLIDMLLTNRGISDKDAQKLFFEPIHPQKITLADLSIDEHAFDKAIKRILKAIKGNEQIIVYGDYDADGVCATAILWQTLYRHTKNVIPFMPDRFIDGYGLHEESVTKLKNEHPDLSLIITVDNGIVANKAVAKANDLGVDVVITDHHQTGKDLPKACAIVHTDTICGSGVSWIVAREINGALGDKDETNDELDLAAIGTIADQMPLLSLNRSFAKHGLLALNDTKRLGLLALLQNSGIEKGSIGTYEVNFQIAPRINAMGRLENAMDALRLLCTTNASKARSYALTLGKINTERQRMLEQMVRHAKDEVASKEWLGAIVVAHETYHEGVIGLIASKLVEEFYRPAIVLSKKNGVSKASARSIHGFNIIENIRKLDHFLSGGGGHPMAAGFSIETSKIEDFAKEMETLSKQVLTEEMLTRKIQIDCALPFHLISKDLLDKLSLFQPFGIANISPLFVTHDIEILDATLIGQDKKHIKMHVSKDGSSFEAIAFNMSDCFEKLTEAEHVDIVYSVDENIWKGKSTIQLKIKDLKMS